MALDFKISTTLRNAAVDAYSAVLDGGTGPATLHIRTNAPPANVSDASTGTLLGMLTFSADSFAAGSGGTATANAITSDTNADASGDAGHFRAFPGAAADTAAAFQGTAGNSGDTPNMVFDNKTIVQGGTIAVSSFTLTQPIQ